MPKIAEQPKEKQEDTPTDRRTVSYSFYELPEGFTENPDVIYLCGEYLRVLEKFVAEAERLVGKSN